MTQPDRQRIQHIRDYCEEIRKTIERYGEGFAVFDQDADYQRSIAFSIFMLLLDVLVSFIQAYVFTMLSAIFIGMAQPEHHAHKPH